MKKMARGACIYILPFPSPDERVVDGRRSKPIPDPALHITPSASVEMCTVDSYLPQSLASFDDERKAFALGESPDR